MTPDQTPVSDSPRSAEQVCNVCHDRIETGLLLLDSSVSVCLECLTDVDRRRLERDLEAAARAQRALLPAVETSHDGWQVAYTWRPAGPVSGDHVDLLLPESETDPIHLLLGDVSGKGVTAALTQSRLYALFRALARPDEELSQVVGQTNGLVAESTVTASYVTLVAARLHANGRIELVNAGHPRPLIADRRGVRPVEGSDLPLGMFVDSSFTCRDLDLAPGSTFLLFTDGVSEAARGDEEFGIGRTAAALRRAVDLPLAELLVSIRSEVDEWLGGDRATDDLTLMAVRRTD